MTTIKDSIVNLIKTNTTILFCGAGISYNSGIPTVIPFIEYLLQRLDVEEQNIKIFKNANMPFELTMEVISEFVDVRSLLDVFNVESPNLNHYLIANLFKENYCNILITTNFDRNIEIALNSIGLFEGQNFELLKSPGEISSFTYNSNKKYLIKIHGSIEDKKFLLTFIERIATNSNQETVFNFLKSLFDTNKTNLLFCGYSFSDHFDINPALESLDKSAKTIYIGSAV